MNLSTPTHTTYLVLLLLIGSSFTQIETLLLRSFANREAPCYKAASDFERQIMVREGPDTKIMTHGQDLQNELEGTLYHKIYKTKYHSNFREVIEAGSKISTDLNDFSLIVDMDISHPYWVYLDIESQREKLINEKCFDIFKVQSVAAHCKISDLQGISDLYKPIIKHYIENKGEGSDDDLVDCEMHMESQKGDKRKGKQRKVFKLSNILKSKNRKQLVYY